MPDDVGIGHNRGPVDPALLDDLRARANEFGAAAIKWGEAGVNSVEDSERCTDFITGARDLWKEVEAARKEAKAPYDEGAKAVQAAFTPLLTAVKKAGDTAKKLQEGFLIAEKRRAEEDARRQREEAARAAREAEARAKAAEAAQKAVAAEEARQEAEEAAKAAAKAAEPVKAQARSDSGAGRTVALRTVRIPEIVNRRLAFATLEKEFGEEFDALIIQLAGRKIRGAKGGDVAIPGIRIRTEERAA